MGRKCTLQNVRNFNNCYHLSLVDSSAEQDPETYYFWLVSTTFYNVESKMWPLVKTTLLWLAFPISAHQNANQKPV